MTLLSIRQAGHAVTHTNVSMASAHEALLLKLRLAHSSDA